MSEIDEVLQLFGFFTLDEVTPEGLKRAFKANIIRAHPDKGGSPEAFDKMLSSYMFLTETVQRVYGGRATLQNIVTPDELKGMRPDEIVNRFFEEFENKEFNRKFEEEHKSEGHGYQDWLKNKSEETNLINGEFGDATQIASTFIFKELQDFNKAFEEAVKKDKPEPSAIILHPEAMAYVSGDVLGTDIIESHEGGYTSAAFTNPEYTDVFSAFTTANTIADKVTTFKETNRSLEDIMNERNGEIKPLTINERQALFEFEKKKVAEQTKHLEQVKNFFEFDAKQSRQLENWPPEKDIKGFTIDF
jgi:hypothetical protein